MAKKGTKPDGFNLVVKLDNPSSIHQISRSWKCMAGVAVTKNSETILLPHVFRSNRFTQVSSEKMRQMILLQYQTI